MTVCYLPVCLVVLILTMKMSAWTRLRLLTAYAGFTITIMLVPIVSGSGAARRLSSHLVAPSPSAPSCRTPRARCPPHTAAGRRRKGPR